MKTVVKNISELIQVESNPRKKVGKEMSELNTIKDVFRIWKWYYNFLWEYGEWHVLKIGTLEIIERCNGLPYLCLYTCICDSREEFVDRINGLSYEEIATKRRNIKFWKTSEFNRRQTLWRALERLNNLIKLGILTEIKPIRTNFRNRTENFRVIKRLKENTEVSIKSTFLWAPFLKITRTTKINTWIW